MYVLFIVTCPGPNVNLLVFKTHNTPLLLYAQGFLLVYDITNRESFENLKTWLALIRQVGMYCIYLIVKLGVRVITIKMVSPTSLKLSMLRY